MAVEQLDLVGLVKVETTWSLFVFREGKRWRGIEMQGARLDCGYCRRMMAEYYTSN